MGVYPRKRARSIVARVRHWARVNEVKPLGFAGYKVGMLHVIRIETNPNSPFYGQEVMKAATVVETPPLKIIGVRFYTSTPYGVKTLTEIWDKETFSASDESKDEYAKRYLNDLGKVLTLPDPEKIPDGSEIEKRIEEIKDKISEVRLIVATQPRKAGIHKKKPEIFEIPIGGNIKEAIRYAIERLGKEISVKEIFKPGQYVDVIAVTKGKGLQGVVKRFNVKILPRWHKHRKGHRRIGSVGPTKPAVMFTTPRAGQTGFHQRTEYNKLILRIGEAADESFKVNPPGGWPHYGLVRSEYMLIEGSIPGPPKRLVKIRFPIRPKAAEEVKVDIVYASTHPVEARSHAV